MNKVKKEIGISLSNFEISKALNNDAEILKYSELSEFSNIKDAFRKKKFLILLYETSENYGHWCCLFMRDRNTIEFFDSYGIMPDDELKFIRESFRIENGSLFPHLTFLLLESNFKIEYNNHKFQRKSTNKSKISTCGRWVIVRCVLHKLTIDQFAEMFLRKNSDELITKLTM